LGLISMLIYTLVYQSGNIQSGQLLSDPEVKKEAVNALVALSPGVMDNFPDPAVSYVLQPGMHDRLFNGTTYNSNRFGIREKEYSLAKPKDMLRIVLLGDSYVYGNGVGIPDRVGVFLEKYIKARKSDNKKIECLHIGIPSWNILAEASFLRRQLYLLKPDLVIHFIVANDLNDTVGVRGFGVPSSNTPLYPERGSSLIQKEYAMNFLGVPVYNFFLTSGLDYESENRYQKAAEAIKVLQGDVQKNGGNYLLIANMMRANPVIDKYLKRILHSNEIAYLPFSLYLNQQLRVSSSDGHWNRAGHEKVATYCYGLIQQRHLLHHTVLSQWNVADDIVADWSFQVNTEFSEMSAKALRQYKNMSTSLNFSSLTPMTAGQVYGGVYRGDYVGPYVSLVLKKNNQDSIMFSGSFLPATTLAGMATEVYVEDRLITTLYSEPGQVFSKKIRLPDSLIGKKVINVRFISNDYVYAANDLRETVSLKLNSVKVVE